LRRRRILRFSIARRLADHSPVVALAIHGALKEQIKRESFSSIPSKSHYISISRPVVVIIDGLDESDVTVSITQQKSFRRRSQIFHLQLNRGQYPRTKYVHLTTSADFSI
jgi:hypothetical protein